MQEASGHSARHQLRCKDSVHKFLVSELPRDCWILNPFHGFTSEKSPGAEMIDTAQAAKGADSFTIGPKSLRAVLSNCCGGLQGH